jgi:ubiquinone/menaquinone biosynthesis C-methylase UbiE
MRTQHVLRSLYHTARARAKPSLHAAIWGGPPGWLAHELSERVFYPIRFARLTEHLAPYLAGAGTVLDVGASCGRLGRLLAKQTGADFLGVDVVLQPRAEIEVRPYDGRALPFADESFDAVLLADVLHHCADPERTLAEARRVARRFVVVKDHYWESRLDRAALCLIDTLSNAPNGIPLPYHFLRLSEWGELFQRQGLLVMAQSRWRYAALDPLKQVTFKLCRAPE